MTGMLRLAAMLLAGLLLLTACGDDQPQSADGEATVASNRVVAQVAPVAVVTPQPSAPGDGWAAYVSEQSASPLSRHGRIRLLFSADLVAEGEVGQLRPDLLLSEPAIAGQVSFVSPRELVLIPDQPLPAGQRYQFTLQRAALPRLPASLDDYQFQLEVMNQSYALQLAELEVLGAASERVSVKGNITTSDEASSAAIVGSLSASLDGQPLQANWRHAGKGRQHSFVFADIVRGDVPRQLQLRWDAQGLGVASTGERQITIPPRHAFQLLRLMAQGPAGEPDSIRIEFSDLLDEKQNLDGLIALSSGAFTQRIDGNSLLLYPAQRPRGAVTVTLEAGIKSFQGRALAAQSSSSVYFPPAKPQLRFVDQGVILPASEQLSVPFEAVNVTAVQVTAFRVYEHNIGQFLQVNNLAGSSELARVGRYLWSKRVVLGDTKADQWQRFAVDLSQLFAEHPGALIRLSLNVSRSDVRYDCGDAATPVPPQVEPLSSNGPDESGSSGWDGIESWYYSDSNERNDPCHDSYYQSHSNSRASNNFIAANIGLIAKNGSDQRWHFATTDIRNGTLLAGAKVRLFNFQGEEIASVSSDNQGLASLTLATPPFYALAEKGKDRGYLKLSEGLALPTSHFDVGGERIKQGVKGLIYGERGVWRPGDTLYLTFVLQDLAAAIPDSHPATLELYDPSGQLAYSQTNTQPLDEFYPFAVATTDSDPTGNWRAVVKLGGHEFSRSVMIEMVMPNRLKLELGSDDAALHKGQRHSFNLFSQWLHGASAAGLQADVNVKLTPAPLRFNRNSDFIFDDPSRSFSGEPQQLFKGQLDAEGKAQFDIEIGATNQPSSLLAAQFTSRVFEPGGAFSLASSSLPFHAYPAYVGLKLPKGDAERDMLLTDSRHLLELASLSPAGEPLALPQVEVSLYKIEWRWWWESGGDGLANFAQAQSTQLLSRELVATDSQGQGRWAFQVNYPDWGRYLVRACDLDGGHCAARVVYIDWPGWAGRAQEQRGPAANALTLASDRSHYQVGETAVISLPPASSGRALLSLENGSRVIQQQWLELKGERNQIELALTPEMAPTVYASVTLLQPHQGKANDRPIRLFGVLPLQVEDPSSRLQPQLEVAASVRPESSVAVKVGEASGRAMNYSLALVDEGLLGLTNFKTPDLHSHFYQREALGVRSWDMFDEVIGAYGGELERLLAVGGSDGLDGDKGRKERKRFPPVVQVLGPFRLAAGEQASHQLQLPAYVGALRLMVVAAKGGAYGAAEKSISVKQPLMVLATLPRVVGPEEELRLPVSVFALEPQLGAVTLSVSAEDGLALVAGGEQQLQFSAVGDQLAFVRLKAGATIGKARVIVKAQAGKEQASQTIDIDIRPSAAAERRSQTIRLAPGEQWSGSWQPFGLPGSGLTTIEVARMAPLNLSERLNYLVQYPHGCLEQTTSAAFPQLYLHSLLPADTPLLARVEANVNAAIARIRQFQRPDGGLSYWPGESEVNPWTVSYVGHFLLEAERAGYLVPAPLRDGWRRYQQQQARLTGADAGTPLVQAYRLYTLTLAGEPEMGAMNRLRELPQLPALARWLLAAGYQQLGLLDVAASLLSDQPLPAQDSAGDAETFASPLRDQALLLSLAPALNRAGDAAVLAQQLAESLSGQGWYHTQELAWALMALSSYVGQLPADTQAPVNFSYRIDQGENKTLSLDQPLTQLQPAQMQQQAVQLSLSHDGQGPLFVTLSSEGLPAAVAGGAENRGLSISASFSDSEGKPLAIDRLQQGDEVIAAVTITNNTPLPLKQIALTQILPPGWELHNPRLAPAGSEQGKGQQQSPFSYRDYRDDRLLTYFDLAPQASHSYQLRFTAVYPGRYFLPAWLAQPMYDGNHLARTAGRWLEVVASPAP